MMIRYFIMLLLSGILLAAGFLTSVAQAGEHEARLEALYDLRKPEGSGPFPAVVLVSGCSGFKFPFYDRAQSKFIEMGFVTARVDYVAARKSSGCGFQATLDQVAEDIFFVVERLSGMDFVKGSSVNILGWSSGGGGVLQVLTMLEQRPYTQVAAVAAYSPQCGLATPWSASVPVLMLLGGADNIAPAKFCRKLVEANAAAEHVMIEEYADAYHGFDDEDLPPKEQFSFGTMGYHPAAAEKAWEVLAGFLIR